MYNGRNLMGFGDPDDDTPRPNRAQRRAQEKRLRAAMRRGQRAHERTLRNQAGGQR